MGRTQLCIIWLFAFLFGMLAPWRMSHVEAADKKEGVVWIYRGVPGKDQKDDRSETERLFAPYGLMPPERASQIAVNASAPIDSTDPGKGTCMEFIFKFKQSDDWMGLYMLLDEGTAWGTKQGIDVQKLLSIPADFKLALRFRAKGKGAVTFKIGGVSSGNHPSSLKFPEQGEQSPTQLTDDFREYTIGPLAAKDLTNLVDPFCVVTSKLDNPARSVVELRVIDVRIEPFEKPRAQAPLPEHWQAQLSQTLWITYTPTNYDPTAHPVKQPALADIQHDLQAVKSLAETCHFAEGRIGIVTYGCKDGLEAIPFAAKDLKLPMIMGVFDPNDPAEIKAAGDLLGNDALKHTIVACCIGNEAITFRRATWPEIEQNIRTLRTICNVPMSTTEIIDSFGDRRLFTLDFAMVNAHAIFSGIVDPKAGAAWATKRIADLVTTAPPDYPILIKEVGWPSGPAPFTEVQQSDYWSSVLQDPIAKKVNFCIFDGFSNVDWKIEQVVAAGSKVNIGPYWPVLFAADRKPKEFAPKLLESWKQSR